MAVEALSALLSKAAAAGIAIRAVGVNLDSNGVSRQHGIGCVGF
jgi:hypothetical protein